jgi:hypothetical protein
MEQATGSESCTSDGTPALEAQNRTRSKGCGNERTIRESFRPKRHSVANETNAAFFYST